MYAVGVGKAVEDELREIASEPVEKHFYYTTDFSAISTIAENLKLNVCPGTGPTTRTWTQTQEQLQNPDLYHKLIHKHITVNR